MEGSGILVKRRSSRSEAFIHDQSPMRVNVQNRVHILPPIKLNISDIVDSSVRQTSEDRLSSAQTSTSANTDRFAQTLRTLNQYKDNLKTDGSLSFRSLPPIKVSFKSNRKAMESPRSEKTSTTGIIRAGYSLRTYRQGHHVFTEGISDISRARNPSFALKRIQVPYANLPDNIQIYKEKNRFAFGVRQDERVESYTTPYKLSSKPFGVENANFARTIEVGKSIHDKSKNTRQSHFRSPKTPIKSKAVLEPLRKPGAVDNSLTTAKQVEMHNPGFLDPKTPANTFHHSANPNKRLSVDKTTDRVESRISVVSIGDSVSSEYFDKSKKHTRKIYPAYDWRSQQRDSYKRFKFVKPRVGSGKTNTSKSTQVKTRILQLEEEDAEDTDHFQTSRNKKDLFSRGRNYQPQVDNGRTEAEYDSITPTFTRSINDYSKYSLWKRQQWRPKSSNSNSSTEQSLFPVNPPPSEIGQYVTDELAHQTTGDYKTEMLTLPEEREKTITVMIPDGNTVAANNHGNESIMFTDEDNYNLPAIVKEDSEMEEENIKFEDVPKLPEIQIRDKAPADKDGDADTDNSESDPEEFVPESLRGNIDMSHEHPNKEIKAEGIAHLEDPVSSDIFQFQEKSKVTIKVINGKPPTSRFLAIPTLELEKQCHHPLTKSSLLGSRSLSRTIQNTPVVNTAKGRDAAKPTVERENTKDKIQLPITSVELYSDIRDDTSVKTPAINLTDEFGEQQEIVHAQNSLKATGVAEKKVLNNKTISFTSPLVKETNAKRQ